MKSQCKSKIAAILFVSLVIAGPHYIEAQQVSPADEHTLALWLFDDTLYPNCILTDAGPYEHDLRLVSGYAKWWMKKGGEISIFQDGTQGSDAESGLITSGALADVKPLHQSGQYGLVKGKFGGGLRLPLGEKGEIIWPDNRQRYANEFLRDRDSYVPERLNIGYMDWTIEFWYKAAGKLESKASVFELRNERHPRTAHMVNALMLDVGRNQFVLLSKILQDDPSRKFHLELAIPSDDERLNSSDWHHYAFTYTATERQLRHYVDGKLQPQPEKSSS